MNEHLQHFKTRKTNTSFLVASMIDRSVLNFLSVAFFSGVGKRRNKSAMRTQ